VRLVHDPVAAQLQVDHVAFFQIDDLVRDASQRHRVARQEVLATVLADAQDQRRSGPRADHALRLVLAEDGNGIGAVQLLHRALHRFEQVAVVKAVDQVGDHFSIGLAGKDVAPGLQRRPQFNVVLDDAVVDQRDPAAAALSLHTRAVAEMGMGVMHRGHAVGRPARVGDAGGPFDVIGGDLIEQFGDP
jgi:hypothetical protein